MNMFVQSASNYKIVDEYGAEYTAAQAKVAWENRLISDFNMAFFTLSQCNWSIEKVKELHAKMMADRLASMSKY